MIFKVLAERNANDRKTFLYDNVTNTLSTEDGFVFEYGDAATHEDTRKEYKAFSATNPLIKSKKARTLKIQLGLSCNYSCDYCSQRFVGRAQETNKKDIDAFLEQLENLEFSEELGLKVEYWGGEPFVYWKTMRPLHDALLAKFASWGHKPHYSVITNGSILTEEICDWLVSNDFAVAVSHDGPGQHVRGPDPFEDPEQKRIVLSLYARLRPLGKMSFNSMLNKNNMSRKEVFDWFVAFTGDPNVPLGEGAMVDAYDEGGVDNSLSTKADNFKYRKQSFSDIFVTQGNIGFIGILDKVDNFTKTLLTHSNTKFLGQKCGMDREDTLAVDLRGNVLTCQNVSSVSTSPSGESHLGGNLSNIDDVKITTATHWSQRDHCSACPVLSICQGSCMFISGDLWHTTCANAYSDAVALFALAIERVTDGYIPIFIDGVGLPDERKDIWGTLLEHKETRKPFPVKVVAATPTKAVIDNVEVYVPG